MSFPWQAERAIEPELALELKALEKILKQKSSFGHLIFALKKATEKKRYEQTLVVCYHW